MVSRIDRDPAVANSGDPSSPGVRRAVNGLRARWVRRTAAFAAVLTVGAVTALGVTQAMVAQFRGSAERVEVDATESARLRADIAEHTTVGHSIIERDADDLARRLAALERSIRAGFEQMARRAQLGAEVRLVQQAEERWEQAVAEIDHGRSSPDRRIAAHVSLADRGEEAAALIDEGGEAGRAVERAQLGSSERFARWAMAAIAALSMLVVVLVARLGRQLTVEVLAPVARLRDSADRLAAGDLDHRAEEDRSDELGELAASFNAMADAIAASHCDLSRQANHDSLTGLPNRAAFRARLDAAVSRPERLAGTEAVVFVDLDDFKDVNDTLGHLAGDELLAVVAARMADAVRPGDLVARLGGDEFAILLDDVADLALAYAIADRAVAAVAQPIELAGSTFAVGASAGVALRGELTDPDELMRRADVAMYLAKGRGKNRVECFDAYLDESAARHNELKADIKGAASRGELVVDYQPIANLATGTVVAVEALVRWQHPTRGLLPPVAFIELAEDTGAIVDIGTCVLVTALGQLRSWQDAHDRADLSVSVNVSVHQLEAPGFADRVHAALRLTGLEPDRLVLEVTESVVLDPAGPAATTVTALRRLGVRIALDDFGTGYSSIGYLRQLPVDILKIDRSFVSGDHASEHGDAILETIVTLGRRLGLDVIPEGIENGDQLARLRRLGCDAGQGYLLSRPVSAAAIDGILAAGTPLLRTELESASI